MNTAQSLDGARSRGVLEITIHRGKTGLVERYRVENLFTDDGLAYIAARCADEAVDPISHMALGTGTTPAAGGNAALEAEIVGSRVPVIVTGTGAARTYTGVFGPGVGTGAVTEAGLLNAATAGLLTNRTVFGTKSKDPDDTFTINWILSHARA